MFFRKAITENQPEVAAPRNLKVMEKLFAPFACIRKELGPSKAGNTCYCHPGGCQRTESESQCWKMLTFLWSWSYPTNTSIKTMLTSTYIYRSFHGPTITRLLTSRQLTPGLETRFDYGVYCHDGDTPLQDLALSITWVGPDVPPLRKTMARQIHCIPAWPRLQWIHIRCPTWDWDSNATQELVPFGQPPMDERGRLTVVRQQGGTSGCTRSEWKNHGTLVIWK